MKNPHDGSFKDLAEDHPELLLRLLGILKPGTKTQIKDILREIRLNPVEIDHAYLVEDEDGQRVVHLEAVTRWHPERGGTLAVYFFALRQMKKLPVKSYLVFMAKKYAPVAMADRLIYEEPDGFRVEAPYIIVLLWELDPAIAFEPGNEQLLPWVPLMKGGAAEFERATEAIGKIAEGMDRTALEPRMLMNRLASLASLRYDKITIGKFLDKLEEKVMLTSEAFKVSWLYQGGRQA